MTNSFRLRVSALHRLHVETSGAAGGIPVVLLHGGPGGLPDPHDLDFFPADRFFRVTFHQRGAGLSRPLGEMRENTLDDMAGDVETLRLHSDIERWMVFGGSFGSALALHYAQSYPAACSALIVHSVVIGRPGFETWDFEGSRAVAPDSWARMTAAMPGTPDLPLHERCYQAILNGGRDGSRATRAWYAHSVTLSAVSTPGSSPKQTPGQARAAARLSAHYWKNRLFLPPGALLANAARLAGLPGAIVHGGDDRNCLLEDAKALASAWPSARLVIVPGAGHSAQEPGMACALREAISAVA